MTLTVGSLFSGIGGLDLGLERAGMKVLWQVEKDPYAQKVLAKHWPKALLYDDVASVHAFNSRHGTGCEHCLPHVDVLCGGFPCQDISNAGKRVGIGGERSGLWREFARLINEIRPSWVVIENVPALRSRGMDVVLRDLSTSGYDAEWDGLHASAFGAPHRRDRVIIVAYTKRKPVRIEQGRGGGSSGPRTLIFGRDGQPGPVADADRQRELQQGGAVGEIWGRVGDGGSEGRMGDANQPGLEVGRLESARQERAALERAGVSANPWTFEPDVGRVAHGVPARVDRLRCLGNAVVPQVAEYVGRLVVAAAGGAP